MAERVFGPADFDPNPHVQPLAATGASVGETCIYDGRPAIICSLGLQPRDPGRPQHVLIRYTDGNRERVLVSPWECAVEVDS